MNTLKLSKHSDEPLALDLAKREVDKDSHRIFSAGYDLLSPEMFSPENAPRPVF